MLGWPFGRSRAPLGLTLCEAKKMLALERRRPAFRSMRR